MENEHIQSAGASGLAETFCAMLATPLREFGGWRLCITGAPTAGKLLLLVSILATCVGMSGLIFKSGFVLLREQLPYNSSFAGVRSRTSAVQWELGYSPDEGQQEAVCLGNKRIVILGDSQGMMVSRALARMLRCQQVKSGARCGEGPSYLDIPDVPTKVMPDARSGPHLHGLAHIQEGCRDCHGCDAGLHECNITGNITAAVEYISLEFARDVSIQGPKYNTTQENVIKEYLQRNPPHYVAFNTGLHDTALNDSSPSTYEENLEWYVSLFSALSPKPKLVFVATTPVNREKQPPEWRATTGDPKIYEYNKRAVEVMQRHGASFIDPWPLLRLPHWQQRYSDGVHIMGGDNAYYQIAAWMILSVFCGYVKVF